MTCQSFQDILFSPCTTLLIFSPCPSFTFGFSLKKKIKELKMDDEAACYQDLFADEEAAAFDPDLAMVAQPDVKDNELKMDDEAAFYQGLFADEEAAAFDADLAMMPQPDVKDNDSDLSVNVILDEPQQYVNQIGATPVFVNPNEISGTVETPWLEGGHLGFTVFIIARVRLMDAVEDLVVESFDFTSTKTIEDRMMRFTLSDFNIGSETFIPPTEEASYAYSLRYFVSVQLDRPFGHGNFVGGEVEFVVRKISPLPVIPIGWVMSCVEDDNMISLEFPRLKYGLHEEMVGVIKVDYHSMSELSLYKKIGVELHQVIEGKTVTWKDHKLIFSEGNHVASSFKVAKKEVIFAVDYELPELSYSGERSVSFDLSKLPLTRTFDEEDDVFFTVKFYLELHGFEDQDGILSDLLEKKEMTFVRAVV